MNFGTRTGARSFFPPCVELTNHGCARRVNPQCGAQLYFFQKNIKGPSWLDTDLNQKMKMFTEQNIAAASEFAQKASNAKDFQDFWRIQTEFMQAQWKAFIEQTKELSESATKSATNMMKGPSS